MAEERSVHRSGLTMPVVTPRFVDNAWRRGCDFINLDLEDSVPQHLKGHARTLIKDAIANVSKGGACFHTHMTNRTLSFVVTITLQVYLWPWIWPAKV